MQHLSPAQTKELLTASEEVAFIDVREVGQYGVGHPFFAVNLPYSRLELAVRNLIPRKPVKILLLDGSCPRYRAEDRRRKRCPRSGSQPRTYSPPPTQLS